MARSVRGVVWAGVAATLLGFFLPWGVLDLRTGPMEKQLSAAARKSLGKTFKSVGRDGAKQPSWIRSKKGAPVIPTRISGFQIPQYANREHVKVITGLVELATKKRERLGLKSYAVYLVPGLALLCGWLLTASGGPARPVAAGVALVCGTSAAAGCWTVLTTDTRAKYAMAIGPGLWLSLAAYAVLALAAAVHVLPDPLQDRVRRLWPG